MHVVHLMPMSAKWECVAFALLVSVVPWWCHGGATVVPWCGAGARSKIKSSISSCLTLLLAYRLLDDDDNNNAGSISKAYMHNSSDHLDGHIILFCMR